MKNLKPALNILTVILTLAYPFAVYFGLQQFEPRVLALYLGLLLLLRLLASNGKVAMFGRQTAWITGVACLAIVIVAVIGNSVAALKLYPVLISFSLLAVFLMSLFYPPTVIERIARIKEPDLPPKGVIYTRNVTRVWCGFFMLNGLIALATSLSGNVDLWVLYNGFISYLLMGILFGSEFLYRTLIVKLKSN